LTRFFASGILESADFLKKTAYRLKPNSPFVYLEKEKWWHRKKTFGLTIFSTQKTVEKNEL
jgi:hypothetical protein